MTWADNERMVRGLIAEGWSEHRARQYVAEEPFRRRSRSGSPETAISGASKGLNSSREVAPFHHSKMERKHEPSPERFVPENGKSRDDHVPGRNR